VALYDQHFEPIIVKDVIISEKEAINNVAVSFD